MDKPAVIQFKQPDMTSAIPSDVLRAEIAEMDKAVRCLYIAVEEEIAVQVQQRWEAVKALLERCGDRDATDYQALYTNLIMAVASKYPNETRHQTALRYINEREQGKHDVACDAAIQTSASHAGGK